MVNLTQNVTGVKKIFADLIRCLHVFSQEIKIVGEKILFKLVMEMSLIFQFVYLNNDQLLIKIVIKLGINNTKIKSEIAEPYAQFVLNFRQTNRNLNAESKKQVTEVLDIRKEMCKAQDDYWKIMKQFEQKNQQAQEMIDLIEKKSATKENFQKQFSNSLKLKELADESEKDYKNLLKFLFEILYYIEQCLQNKLLVHYQNYCHLIRIILIKEKVTDLEIKLKEDAIQMMN